MPVMTCRLCDPPVQIELDADPTSPLAVREYNARHYDRTHGHLVGVPDDLAGPGQMWRAAAHEAIATLAAGGGEFTFTEVAGVVGQPINSRDWLDLSDDLVHRAIAHPRNYDPIPVRLWRGGSAPERTTTE